MFTDNKDFYPTPEHLVNKMLFSLDFDMIKSVLEPSAGKGDIVEKLEEKYSNRYSRNELDIDCIEKDMTLQHILKGKRYRVVHDDFLTFDTMKEYDLIIMNPPFSNGCNHLLKAINIQEKNGGAIICILNAETLKNAYSNSRKILLEKLEELSAEVEYLSECFSNAERKTNVEIALVKIIISKKNQDSFILSGLKKAIKEDECYREDENNQLVDRDLFKAIVNQYNMEVEAGIKFIKEYYAMSPYVLSEFDAEGQKGKPILNLDLSSNYYGYSNTLSINEYIKEVRGKYWTALFNNPKFTGKLTENLKREFFKKVKELRDYDFSLYNIYQLKIDINNNVIKGVEETIVSLFEELSYKHHWHDEYSKNIHLYNGWKTNKSYIINKKVIIPLRAWRELSGYNPTYYNTKEKLSDIEKCFNYLDGGLTESVDLEESLKFAEDFGESKNIQLKYFTITFYKKGTCHITFTNLELLKKFNIFGSQKKGWLPPSYGKKDYNNMTSEEKEVINEFEGENSYNETITKSDYYLFDSSNMTLLEEKD